MSRFYRLMSAVLLMLALACTDNPHPKDAPELDDSTALDDSELRVCDKQGRDGEGCARFVGPDSLMAGDTISFAIDYYVGSAGLAPGAAVSVGIHHAAKWGAQASAVKSPGYVSLSGDTAHRLTLRWFRNAPPGMFKITTPGLDSNAIYHRVFVATVTGEALQPGERIRFQFGSDETGINVPGSLDNENEFRVTSDTNADQVFEAIADSPRVRIEAAEARALSAITPSQAVVGEPVVLHVKLEDRFYNLVDSWSGDVSVVDEQGVVLLPKVVVNNGHTTTSVVFNSAGHHRLRLRSSDGMYIGRSNPIRVYTTSPTRKLYWSDLHGHTQVSDGLGASADNYFRFGRDIAHLDVVALTDHANFDWPANIKAVQDHYSEGNYVTLLAQEAGAGPDHMNLYFRRDNAAHLSRWHTRYDRLLDWIHQQYNTQGTEAITAPHHFAYDRAFAGDSLYPFGVWDERSIRFVEVYSSHGTSEFPGNPRPLKAPSTDASKYMQTALAKGLKFGVIAASDNHDSHPGRTVWGHYAGGLAGIWANELTRESIWQALHDYQTYGTSLDRIYLEFEINNQPVGSQLVSSDTNSITAYIIGKTDNLEAVLIRDNEEIAVFESNNGLIEIDHDDLPGTGQHFYYLRVTQDNGERAWSTPIWLERPY